MNQIKSLISVLVLGILLANCSGSNFKKTPGGMPYQLFASKDTQSVRVGNFIKVSLTQKINDSVYFSTAGKLPLYLPVGQNSNPYDISEVWTKLHLGDSVIATQMMDTFIKRMPPGNLPPQFKNGDRILTYVKVLGIFTSDSLRKLDEQKETAAFTAGEAKEVEAYLKKNNITNTQKTASGAYVQVLEPGTGELVKENNYVSVSYTGKTLAGLAFDSNVDTTFKHTEPLNFSVGVGQMIKGFDEGMVFLRKGAKAVIYMPSTLGYGAAPPPGAPIKPYEHLLFEVTVLDVKDKAPATPQAEAPQPSQH